MLTDPNLITAFERLIEAINKLDNTVNFGSHKSKEVTSELIEAKYYLDKAKKSVHDLGRALENAANPAVKVMSDEFKFGRLSD